MVVKVLRGELNRHFLRSTDRCCGGEHVDAVRLVHLAPTVHLPHRDLKELSRWNLKREESVPCVKIHLNIHLSFDMK